MRSTRACLVLLGAALSPCLAGCGSSPSTRGGSSASCVPTCLGKACGDDGCGGSCGACASIQSCAAGQCVWPPRGFAADVYPVVLGQGCGATSCHGGARPAQGLDLSSEPTAYADLVGVASAECAARDRVAAGDLAGSYLVNKITGTGLCAGARMPLGGELSEAEIETIEAWIATGAPP